MARIGFLGTGIMGAPMARNLMEAGHQLAVYNRTAEKTAPLVDAGARHAETPAAAADGAEFVISMVGDDFEMDNSGWTCGKDGQSVPVSLGMPTVLVDGIVVGGSAT